MGQMLHCSARTTAAVRRAIQHSQESLNRLAQRYAVNPKIVAKWKRRSFVRDAPMGPKARRSTVLAAEQEATTGHNNGLPEQSTKTRIDDCQDNCR